MVNLNYFNASTRASQVELVVKSPDPSLSEGNSNPLQYSCLENSMDKGGYSPWSCEESDTTEHTHTMEVPDNLQQKDVKN